MDRDKNVCTIGLGYVGLTLALTLADSGFCVTGVDKNPSLLKKIKRGISPFYEKGLETLLKKYLGENFKVSDHIPDDDFGVFIISVGTPVNRFKKPVLKEVLESSREVSKHIKKGDLLIGRSTVPVGTTRGVVGKIVKEVGRLKMGEDYHLVYAPERTIEGRALKELRELPQIVGGINEESVERASIFFRRITQTIVNVSSLEAAEMIKIMDNTYRDLNFAISNELTLICDKIHIDAVEIIKAANMGYNRNNIPLPSPGVGGICLSKDPYILIDVARKAGYETKLIRQGRLINESMPKHMAKKLERFVKRNKLSSHKLKVFVMGFAFKGRPLTSDMRNSPTIDLVEKMRRLTGNICGYDPAVPKREIEQLGVKSVSMEEGFDNADCVVIMLNHEMYEDLNIFSLIERTKKPLLFLDGWQIYNPREIRAIPNVYYEGVGF